MATQSALQYCQKFTHSYTRQRPVSLARPAGLAQGHLYTELGGAGGRTCNLLVVSHPALPCSTLFVGSENVLELFLAELWPKPKGIKVGNDDDVVALRSGPAS